MNKQIEIEDMAFDLCRIDTCKHLPQAECHNTTCAHCEAEALYNAGYRRVSDVARGIDDIRRYIILNENIAKKCKEENGEQNEEYWKGKLSAFKQIRGYIDTELRKKYESEGGE